MENLLTSFFLPCKQWSSQHHFFRERKRKFYFFKLVSFLRTMDESLSSQISDPFPPPHPLLFVEGLSGTLCWPGALPCPGKGKGWMNWKPEVCGIFSHGKYGTLLFCFRVLQMLPVEISMVLFSNFLLKHFPFNCDLLQDYFFFSSIRISTTSLCFS